MLVPMAKVEIIGPKNLFFDVVSLIHEQGSLHIEDLTRKIESGEVPLDRMEVYDQQLRDQERMEELLIRVRSIVKALQREDTFVDAEERKKEYGRLYELDPEQLGSEISNVVEEVEDRTAELAASHTSLEGEIALLARYEPILEKIQPLAKQIVTTGAYESVALLVERRYKTALEQLKEELDKLTHKQCEIVSTDVDEDTTAAIIVFSKTYSDPVHKFLAMENVNQIRLPNEFNDMPFDVAYDELKARRKSLPEELKRVSAELERMSISWQTRLTAIRDVLTDKIDEIGAIPKFGRTEYAFVITGWMPVDDVGGLRKLIGSNWGDDVIVNQTEITEKEFNETPVALQNPKYAQPFELLTNLRGLPKYGTIDPTIMLFLFYPLLFGMIVGDFGYGLVLLGLVIWMRRKFKENAGVQMATSILGPAATSVVIFGLLYGEFFGDVLGPHYLDWIKPITVLGIELPFHRVGADLMMVFMYMAIGVGVVHVLLGLVLGAVNAVRTKSKHHLHEKLGILGLLLGAGAAVVFSTPLVTGAIGDWSIAGRWLFAGVAAVGLVVAVMAGKMMALVEILESVSGMASYIRIMAVGLAGAIFADAVNGIVADLADVPLAGIFLGVLLHTLNFVIVVVSPSIHAIRLNFLEFFTKFHETGEQQYSPFTKTGGD